MQEQFDVMIAGGGMVGATAACSLAQGGIKVALLEQHLPDREWQDDTVDLRVSALTLASQNILTSVGAWPGMVRRGVSAYQKMRVWDDRSAGELYFDSADTGYDQLGHIVENRVTVSALWEVLENLPGVRCICPARVVDMQTVPEGRRLFLDDGRDFEAKLVIAADGRDSRLRKMAGIEVMGWPYQQTALVATVSTEKSHQNTAWQRFLAEGPLAFLPLKKGQCSIVWTLAAETAKQHLKLPDKQFLQLLEDASAGVLGTLLAVGQRATFPLRFQAARNYTAEHFVLLGDAAHAMHPLAGQGVNAGLLDAAALAELLVTAAQQQRPIASQRVLRRYERWRKGDNLAMAGSMDVLNKVFALSASPLAHARAAGMNWINHSQWLKQFFNRYAMGLRADLPRLAKDFGKI